MCARYGLGNLFKNADKRNDQSELMVFITPRIVTMTRKENGGATETMPSPAFSTEKPKEEAIPADNPKNTTQGTPLPPQ